MSVHDKEGLPEDLLTSKTSGKRQLKVDTGNDKGAFGELSVVNDTPITQVSAQYGLLNSVLTILDSDGVGSNTIVDNKFSCQTGEADNSLASILTLRQLAYRAGQGAKARFTALFSEPLLGSTQAAGLINAEDSFAFGSIGIDFGVIHSHSGVSEAQLLTITSPATGSENATVTLNGIGYTVPLTSGTAEHNAFEIAQSLTSQAENFRITSNQNTVYAINFVSKVNAAYSFSSATAAGSFTQKAAGIEPITELVKQDDWNVDIFPELDVTKGNVYQVQFQYLGFGGIQFSIEDPDSAKFRLVHVIRFANQSTVPSVTNPTFRVGWLARNKTATRNTIVEGASCGAFVEGLIVREAISRSHTVSASGVGTSSVSLFFIRSRWHFNNKINRVEMFPQFLSAAAQANKPVFFDLVVNPVFSGSVNYSYVDEDNSIMEVSDDTVAITGGDVIATVTVAAGNSQFLKLNEGQLTVFYPGTLLCIAARVVSGSSADAQASITWQEDL